MAEDILTVWTTMQAYLAKTWTAMLMAKSTRMKIYVSRSKLVGEVQEEQSCRVSVSLLVDKDIAAS